MNYLGLNIKRKGRNPAEYQLPFLFPDADLLYQVLHAPLAGPSPLLPDYRYAVSGASRSSCWTFTYQGGSAEQRPFFFYKPRKSL